MSKDNANHSTWFTSTYSSGNGQCVQVRHQEEGASVRDSVHPNRAVLDFSKAEWHAFLREAVTR